MFGYAYRSNLLNVDEEDKSGEDLMVDREEIEVSSNSRSCITVIAATVSKRGVEDKFSRVSIDLETRNKKLHVRSYS